MTEPSDTYERNGRRSHRGCTCRARPSIGRLRIQARGALKKELVAHLRSRRTMRRSQTWSQRGKGNGQFRDAISFCERPAEVQDRAVPGHREGDLLMGSKCSQISHADRGLEMARHADLKAAVVAGLPDDCRQAAVVRLGPTVNGSGTSEPRSGQVHIDGDARAIAHRQVERLAARAWATATTRSEPWRDIARNSLRAEGHPPF